MSCKLTPISNCLILITLKAKLASLRPFLEAPLLFSFIPTTSWDGKCNSIKVTRTFQCPQHAGKNRGLHWGPDDRGIRNISVFQEPHSHQTETSTCLMPLSCKEDAIWKSEVQPGIKFYYGLMKHFLDRGAMSSPTLKVVSSHGNVCHPRCIYRYMQITHRARAGNVSV